MGLLRDLGYPHVRHYAGGMQEWIEQGGRLEGAASLARPEAVAASRGTAPRRSSRWLGSPLARLADLPFSALLGLWLQMVLGCGLAYWALGLARPPGLIEVGTPVPATLEGLASSIYFSFVTATSIGFGDVVPVGAARLLAILEGAAGLLLFGCVISKLVSRRQEELIEEIHHIAFEDRLGRVRTNLHLVLSELQSLAAECSANAPPPPGLQPRMESAAMVFSGELRAIHELLFRPQQEPAEEALEAILASLDAALRALCDLMECRPDAAKRSGLLTSNLRSIRRLASEICGECVPKQYAPELTLWMDRIQELSRRLSSG